MNARTTFHGDLQSKVLQLMADGKERWSGEISERIKCRRSMVVEVLLRLAREGVLVASPINEQMGNGYRLPKEDGQ